MDTAAFYLDHSSICGTHKATKKGRQRPQSEPLNVRVYPSQTLPFLRPSCGNPVGMDRPSTQMPCGSGFDEPREAAASDTPSCTHQPPSWPPAAAQKSSATTSVLRTVPLQTATWSPLAHGFRLRSTATQPGTREDLSTANNFCPTCATPALWTPHLLRFARSQAPESGLQEVPPPPSAIGTLTFSPRYCGTRFASPFSHETRSVHSAVKSSTVSATTRQCATAQATAVADRTRKPMYEASLPLKKNLQPRPVSDGLPQR